MVKFCQQAHPIECLDVDKDFALEMFRNNVHKTKQIPDIAAHNGDKVTLFKAGHHVDISRGPMVANTDHLGRITVCNVFKLDTDITGGPIYRFQGVALPKSIILNHFAYGIIEDRGKILVIHYFIFLFIFLLFFINSLIVIFLFRTGRGFQELIVQ